jgi:hypothetical protein
MVISERDRWKPLISQSYFLCLPSNYEEDWILDNDAMSTGISYDKLTKSKQSLLGLGGLVETYIAKNAKLHFRAQDDSELADL